MNIIIADVLFIWLKFFDLSNRYLEVDYANREALERETLTFPQNLSLTPQIPMYFETQNQVTKIKKFKPKTKRQTPSPRA